MIVIVLRYNSLRSLSGSIPLFISSFSFLSLPPYRHRHRFSPPPSWLSIGPNPGTQTTHFIIIIMLDRILTILPRVCAIPAITFQGTKYLVNRYQYIRAIFY